MATFNNAIGTVNTVAEAVYTSPPAGAGAIITSATLANITEADLPTVTVTVTKAGVTKTVLYKATVPVNGTLTLKPESQLILKPGNTLNLQASAANAIDFVISATEL